MCMLSHALGLGKDLFKFGILFIIFHQEQIHCVCALCTYIISFVTSYNGVLLMILPWPALAKKVLSDVVLQPEEKIKYVLLTTKQPVPPIVNLFLILFIVLVAISVQNSRNFTAIIGFLTSICSLLGLWMINSTAHFILSVTNQRVLLTQFGSLNNPAIKNQWASSLSDAHIVFGESGLFFTAVSIRFYNQNWSLKVNHLGTDKSINMQNLKEMQKLFQPT